MISPFDDPERLRELREEEMKAEWDEWQWREDERLTAAVREDDDA